MISDRLNIPGFPAVHSEQPLRKSFHRNIYFGAEDILNNPKICN